jgi:RNA polymerase sigma factor (sigma-70 family)
MTPLAALLRQTADPAPAAALLARVRIGDPAAFAELVRRHGRLVWAACRHQTRSAADADDCFQAVWLALARRPAAVRDPARLAAFLHAVAVRVCRKHRLAASRRVAREAACAVPDRSTAVPDSAWDRALAAVHEEVAALPEPLRVAFVRCCLDGQGVTEAAADLGWKLGTLSGRLTRAKQRLMKRLGARGLAAVPAAGAAVPPAVAGRALDLFAGPVPASLLSLSHGVILMSRWKIMAAGLVLAGGLGAGVGGWRATAQDKPAAAKAVPTPAPMVAMQGTISFTGNANRWEYDYLSHAVPAAGASKAEFETLLRGKEDEGWWFVGVIPIKWEAGNPGGPPGPTGTLPTAVFRRPARQVVRVTQTTDGKLSFSAANGLATIPLASPADRIAALEKELAVLKAAQAAEARTVRTYHQNNLSLGVDELATLLSKLGKRQFADGRLVVTVGTGNGGSLTVTGDREVQEWADRVLEVLTAIDRPLAK